ncbi:MAG: TSUP family transporter [Deltaproteobacteria bacterium]|nr:TSUP family transporter [Deltaproteobacteria bacterium]
MVLLVLVCGLVAGAVSTLAGQGGGLLALLALSAALGPREALVMSAPALAVANIHRAWMYRATLARPVVLRLAAAVLPASVLAGAYAVHAPTLLLRALLVFATALALARGLGWVRLRVPVGAYAPAGVVIGAFGATSGGAGVLLTPVLVSAGLTGEALAGSTAAVALALNSGRLVGYGVGGSFVAAMVANAALMTAALLLGNVLGDQLRGVVKAHQLRRFELAAMVVAAALVVSGARA